MSYRQRMPMAVLLAALMLTGCVSTDVHTKTLGELEQVRSVAEAATKRSAGELQALKAENARLAEEVARLQQEVAEGTSRMTALGTQLGERDQAIIKLRDFASEYETVTAQLKAATEELAGLKKRAATLAAENDNAAAKLSAASTQLSAATSEIETMKQRSEELTASLTAATEEARKQQASLRAGEDALAKLREEQLALTAQLQQEQADKQTEIQRLTQTQADLSKSLQSEIAKGEIRIQQVADRLTINMVDRVLFDSGQGQVKPAGLKVLKQVSDILKTVKDKQIRIEGHTDNVKIGGKLKERFPTNWELSTTRATSVVRFLVDQGGVDPANISAVGYADMRPIAVNDNEDGRSANRRIEIVLYPKDLKQIVQSAIETSGASSPRP